MTPPITIEERPHVVIRASAGSGKTYQLSSRYLDLLHRNAGPESILATTFTRKAAGEILERILRRLALAATDAKHAAELAAGLNDKAITVAAAKAMLVALCRSLHRVSVSTIDSFFNRIASTFRYELRLPPNPQVVDDNDELAARVRGEAIEAMLGDADTQVLIDLLRRLHHDSTNRGVTAAIDAIVSSLYATYRQTRREHWHQLKTGVPLESEYVAGLVSQLPLLLSGIGDQRLADAVRKANDAASSGAWEAFLQSGLPCKVRENPVNPTYHRKPISPAIVDAYHQLNQHARAVLLARIAAQTAATYDLLARFDGHYTRLRDQRRLLLFSDLPYKLAHDLDRGDDAPDLLTEICYRLDSSVGHLLLDEFQDTSFDQWKILRPFAEEITSFSDRSRTFFCVGDVKQAIYGWRGGRAEIFDRIESDLHLPDEAQVSLAESYRSSQVVLDAVNTLFRSLGESAAWKDDGPHREEAARWSARFEDHSAQRDRAGFFEIITSPAAGQGGGGDDEENGEASTLGHEDYAAARIAEWAHAAPAASIGVLVTTNEAAASLIYCLRRLKVDASAEGRTRIIGEPAVDVVLAALKLADHPGDTAAAFHIVNSPLGPVIGLRSMAAAEVERISRAVRAEVFARGYAAVTADWARALAPSCDARGALRLTQLVELAERFEPGVALRTRQFIEMVNSSLVEEPVQAQVRVMTVHKAKGLEFDIVVLPQMKKKVGAVRLTAVMIDRDDATDEVRAVYRATNDETRELSDDLKEAYRQEQVRRLRDDLCALYVAMTRPRHALHIILEPLESTKSGSIAAAGYSDQSYAALLRHCFCDDVEREDRKGGQRLFSAGDEAWHRSLSTAAAVEGVPGKAVVEPVVPRPVLANAAASRRTWRKVAPSTLHGETSIRIADLLDLKTDESRQRGTLMHAWCRHIEWLGAGGAALPGDDVLLAHAARECEMAGDPRWAAAQLAAFRQMIGQSGIVAALTRPTIAAHQSLELWRERSFVVRLGGNLLRGSFDRVAILRESGRVIRAQIIDFKTDHAARAALPALVDRYRPQIQAYREALASMLALDAKLIAARLVFLAAGESREV